MADDASKPSSDSVPASEPSVAGTRPPELPVLKFSLRHLLAFVAVLCVLLAGVVGSNGMTSMVFLLAALVVALHVTGTALGSRLRAHADQQRAWDAAHGVSVAGASASTAARSTRSAASPLYGRHSALRWLPLLVAGGALLGTVGGAVLLALTTGHRSGAIGIAVGAISLGVVGGWFAFLGTSFWTILRQGWREAVSHQRQDEARRAADRK